ncbi:nucleotide-diphospho-sugar transferase [Pluteus cervinus]|uniref:Nucleotide-diphospho-sugar transferase n=1 Tax=Pluteus cervinus TaxID=181527 RepID=A0ACD3BF46_9AGAR|nr:nucleotide-diphospho-sugar transferase [Pluteus cervinus]
MAQKSAAAGKEHLIDSDEEVLQAVVLADSFNKRFRPLTTQKPRCLLPVCNAPLLDWTFESLALAGVQEIFVVCRSHASQVKKAIKDSKWSKPGSGIKIVPIMTAKETFSPGDAMRDIYTRGLVTSDFVLVMGDLISNIRIDEVVRVHKERRKTNKDAIMTMVVKESGVQHRTRIQADSAVFVLQPETSECLYYEPISGHPPTTTVRIPREVLAGHSEVEIRNDLIDCSIDICSVEVPSLFQDNFDYSDIRRDFVHGVLTSDLLMKNVYCYVATEGYAARVKDTKSYDSVSKDILSRWTFPLVPDDNHPGGHLYEQLRGNKYLPKDNSVSLARTCKIGNNTLIGASSKLGENVQVLSSVVGQNCVVDSGTTIRDAYIFDGTKIGANCTVTSSIIGAGVTILDHTYIPRGCLIADGVILGPHVTLKPFDRLTKRREAIAASSEPSKGSNEDDDQEEEDSDLDEIEAGYDAEAYPLGQGSNAVLWPQGPPEEEDEDDVENHKNLSYMRIGDDSWDPAVLDRDEDSDNESETSDEGESSDSFAYSAASSATSLPLGVPTIPTSDAIAESEFKAEVTQSLERAFAEDHSVDNAAVELKTLRMASNVPFSRVREAVVAAIVDRIKIVDGAVPQRKEIATVITRWGPLIDQIGGIDAVETISCLQLHCAQSPRLPIFGQILAALYQADFVDEDDIRAWHASPTAMGVGQPESRQENYQKCRTIGSHMIQQFDEQESEEDDDDDE